MEYRWLGHTGICLSRLGIGTGAFPEAGAPDHGARLLCEAERLCLTFWDTANIHETYREIALALKQLGPARARIVISSKIEAKTARGARRQLDSALRALRRGWVDIILLHYVRESLSCWESALDTLHKAKRRGEVLAVGLSTHNPRFVRDGVARKVVDCVFVTLNVAGTWVEGRGGTRSMIEACQDAARTGVGVVLLKVLGNGALIPQRSRALRWAIGQAFADGVIVGTETIAQLRDTLRYFGGRGDPC